MSYPAKEIWRNVFSVVAGVITASIIFYLTLILYALLTFDIETQNRLEVFSEVLIAIGIILSLSLSGYITGIISTRKDAIHGTITGIIFTFLIVLLNDFELDFQYVLTGISYFIVPPFVLTGTLVAIKTKNKKQIISDIASSPPGIPSQ